MKDGCLYKLLKPHSRIGIYRYMSCICGEIALADQVGGEPHGAKAVGVVLVGLTDVKLDKPARCMSIPVGGCPSGHLLGAQPASQPVSHTDSQTARPTVIRKSAGQAGRYTIGDQIHASTGKAINPVGTWPQIGSIVARHQLNLLLPAANTIQPQTPSVFMSIKSFHHPARTCW